MYKNCGFYNVNLGGNPFFNSISLKTAILWWMFLRKKLRKILILRCSHVYLLGQIHEQGGFYIANLGCFPIKFPISHAHNSVNLAGIQYLYWFFFSNSRFFTMLSWLIFKKNSQKYWILWCTSRGLSVFY